MSRVDEQEAHGDELGVVGHSPFAEFRRDPVPGGKDRNGLDVLPHDECLRLLATAPFGRVAVWRHGVPALLPVSFTVVDDDVLFRTSSGSKLAAAVEHEVLAFEADGIDADGRNAWSVCVTGLATCVTRPADVLATSLVPWSRLTPPVAPHHVVRIRGDLVSGRRLRLSPI